MLVAMHAPVGLANLFHRQNGINEWLQRAASKQRIQPLLEESSALDLLLQRAAPKRRPEHLHPFREQSPQVHRVMCSRQQADHSNGPLWTDALQVIFSRART